MALEIIGAGFGRTGTLSLKGALEQLGFVKCYHMAEVMQRPEHDAIWVRATRGQSVDWDALFDGYRAAIDWPVCHFWRELSAQYPRAKIILTTRDAQAWFKSMAETILHVMQRPLPEDPAWREHRKMVIELVGETVFGGRLRDKDHIIGVFQRHNDEVRRSVPAGRLLEYDMKQGWGPLCAFLGVPVPATPFPKVNTTDEFRDKIK